MKTSKHFPPVKIDNFSINDVTEITPSLFVCGKTAINDTVIKDLGINLIINSAKELENYADYPGSQTLGSEIISVKIPVYDQVEGHLLPYFMMTAELIKANEVLGGKTIVHCIAGVSRSVSLCAAYLMTNVRSEKGLFGNNNMGATEAVKYIQKRRPCANPNPSFMHQLKKFEKQLKTSSNTISIENDLTEEQANVLESMKKIIEKINLKST